jgi:GNAT superfamily N-acetyltransferase
MSTPEVVEITASDTHPLRLAVLRFDTPTKDVVFAEDEWPGSWHLGLRVDGVLVGTSSWVPRPHGNRHAVQLRGMATDRSLQGTGLGGVLLEEGCRRAAAAGFPLVWARARDAALEFYLRHEFVVEGEGFIDQTTQLPHHLVVRELFPMS